MADVTSIIGSLLSNGELAQLGFGGVLGYLIGWGFKKLVKLISMIVSATLAIVGAILLYLNSQGVISINYGQLESLISNFGEWVLGMASSALQGAQLAAGSLSLVGGVVLGFLYGFKKG
ncbi:MAG: FUN14 domain-containing protein [Candidatus Bathyarchaeia archaeon]